MKNLLSKRKILIICSIILIPLFLAFFNSLREKTEFEQIIDADIEENEALEEIDMSNQEEVEHEKIMDANIEENEGFEEAMEMNDQEKTELERVMNMNNDVFSETYDFDMSERPREIDNVEIEYVKFEGDSSIFDIARMCLPEATKAYTINTIIESNTKPKQECHITMDHPDYEFSIAVRGNSAISIFPSGEVRASSDDALWYTIVYKRKNEEFMLFNEISFSCQNVHNIIIFLYKNGLIIEADYFGGTNIDIKNEEQQHSSSFSFSKDKYTDQKGVAKRVWVTKNENGEPLALIDTDDDNIFDTNIIKRTPLALIK